MFVIVQGLLSTRLITQGYSSVEVAPFVEHGLATAVTVRVIGPSAITERT